MSNQKLTLSFVVHEET